MSRRSTFTVTRHLPRSGREVTTPGLTPGRVRALVSFALTDNGYATKHEAAEFVRQVVPMGLRTHVVHEGSGFGFTVEREQGRRR